MYTQGRQAKKTYMRSLVQRAAAAWRKVSPGRNPSRGSRKANTVHRYQRPLVLKRLLRSVNFCLAAAACALSVAWFAFMLLAKSDIFQVAAVEVSGNRVATEYQILEKAGLTRGMNLLSFDSGEVAENVRSLPWIAEVNVRRSWPSTVMIEVREHKPLALINLPDNGGTQLFYIDAGGQVFAPALGATDLDFPVLTGTVLPDELRDRQVKQDSLTEKAMQFLRLAAQGNHILPLQAVSEVRVSREKGLIVYLVDHPFPIYLGEEKIRERYHLLVRLLAQLYDKDKIGEIREIRMDYAENKIMVAGSGNS